MSPLSTDPAKRAIQLANLRSTPAPLGNTRTLLHGGNARKATLVAAGSWAAAIFAQLEEEAPLRDRDGRLPVHDRQVVELLASALARLQAVEGWLANRPAVTEKGMPWPVEDTARRLRREVAGYLEALGMTPRARVALGLDLALTRRADPSAVLSEPDPLRRRAGMAELGLTVDGDAEEQS